jgi:hypothetical protein
LEAQAILDPGVLDFAHAGLLHLIGEAAETRFDTRTRFGAAELMRYCDGDGLRHAH